MHEPFFKQDPVDNWLEVGISETLERLENPPRRHSFGKFEPPQAYENEALPLLPEMIGTMAEIGIQAETHAVETANPPRGAATTPV